MGNGCSPRFSKSISTLPSDSCCWSRRVCDSGAAPVLAIKAVAAPFSSFGRLVIPWRDSRARQVRKARHGRIGSHLVWPVLLVPHVALVHLVYPVGLVQLNKRDKLNKPDEPDRPDTPVHQPLASHVSRFTPHGPWGRAVKARLAPLFPPCLPLAGKQRMRAEHVPDTFSQCISWWPSPTAAHTYCCFATILYLIPSYVARGRIFFRTSSSFC